jgi:hypothetical protein
MSPFAASSGQIILSVAAPVLFVLLLWTVEKRGPLAPAIQKTKGVVAPYFSSIAVLFGLFTALLMSDVWQKDSEARQSVQAEDSALRGLLHLARVNGLEAKLLVDIKTYVAAASQENPFSRADSGARNATDRAYEALFTTVQNIVGLDTPTMVTFQGVATELRHARDRRLYLTDDATAPIKWLSILVLGALTQIAILMVHIGNRRAMHASTGLFTVAFTLCLLFIAIFDMPFEIALAREPAATLNHMLKGL